MLHLCLIASLLIAAVQFSSSEQANLSVSPRITNGIVATPADFPYIASIEVADIATCGGSIIKPYVVLTAAHCTSKYPAFLLKVRAGTAIVEDYKGPTVQLRLVKRIVNHPQYNISAYNDNDIAILWLKTPFTLNNFVNVVNLATQEYTGETAVIIGWGADENFKEGEVLKRGKVLIISNDACAKMSLTGYKITSNMVCATGIDRQTICKGDSGGPMVIHDAENPKNDVLVGVTSYGRIINRPLKRFCDPKAPAVYTNILAKRQWILDEIERGV